MSPFPIGVGPVPQVIANGHGLFVAAWNAGNMGASIMVFRGFCTCGAVGHNHHDEAAMIAAWRRHAESSDPKPKGTP